MKHSFLVLLLFGITAQTGAAESSVKVTIEAEDEVYHYENPDNGSGPFWCFGSTCIVRHGETVLVSGVEKIADAKPLNNTRWMLYARTDQGWKLQQKDAIGRTREPSPLGIIDGTVLLSANPTLAKPDAYSGPAQPQILRFDVRQLDKPFQTILPSWDGQPAFTEHSYRSFAVDGSRREMVLLQNIGYTHAEWTFCDSTGARTANGRLDWPFSIDYATPRHIRICYPCVQLRDRAVYFCGVSDIDEPNEAWRSYKEKLTGRKWDYDFRRLFFTWTPDITSARFKPWVEVASREKTCGWIFPCDLWAEADGMVHILWTERALDTRLREKFFPNEKQSEALNYSRIKDGQITVRQSILLAKEGDAQAPVPGRGRFHVMPDGRLFVFLHARVRDAAGRSTDENRLVEIRSDGSLGAFITVPLKQPLTTFFTASVLAGCVPSDTLDVLGEVGQSVRYAKIRLGQ